MSESERNSGTDRQAPLRRPKKPVEIVEADLTIAGEESGYNPYDNPGSSKPSPEDGELPKWRRRRDTKRQR
ncbi:MAG: hypothetical protein KJO82_00290 [Gammaproteobacteria bacterium]|nr:hypothetical protein [Gammaproteobacteria bacterium]